LRYLRYILLQSFSARSKMASNMETKLKHLEWEAKYSVEVAEIDEQHKAMFATINLLIDAIGASPTKEKLSEIIARLVQYKRFHFETEENYFKKFNYEGTAEHVKKHHEFNVKLEEVQKKCGDDVLMLAYELIDFLEDWLINHLMTVDQEYKECFKAHGLK